MNAAQNKSQRHKLHDTLLSSQTSHAPVQSSRICCRAGDPTRIHTR